MHRQLFNAMLAQYATPEVSGNGLVSWEGGKKCVIPSVKLYGAAVQDGTPTPDAPIMPVCNNGVFAAQGKNLLNVPREMTSSQADNPSGTTDVTLCVPTGTTLTLGRWIKYNANDAATNRRLTMVFYYVDGTFVSKTSAIGALGNDGLWHYECISNTITKPTTKIQVRLADYSSQTVRDWAAKDVQLLIGSYAADSMPPYTSYYDGGQAQAPELWAIPGTDIRDEWDCRTGWGIRRCAVIDSYAGEIIDTPYISSTGALTEGATVVHGIPDIPFAAAPARLTMPTGYGQIVQVSGNVADCPIAARYLTHS